MSFIHPTAILSKDVIIQEGVEIGPYCVLEGKIEIKKGTKLKSHVYIKGEVYIGENNIIYPFVSIGTEPQDAKFKEERSYVKIGNNNTIREYVTINGGSELGNLFKKIKYGTIIEDDCYLMINSHIAHDCFLENDVVVTNNVCIAGHCLIEKNSIIGGASSLHQFIRIGCYSMIGGMCGIGESVLPYSIVFRESDKISGLNIIGLKRSNFSTQDINDIKEIYNLIFKEGNKINIDIFDFSKYNNEIVVKIKNFLQDLGKRGLVDFSQRVIDKGF